MMGCYSFPLHVGVHHPDVPMGVEVPTLLDALRAAADCDVTYAQGCPVLGGDDAGHRRGGRRGRARPTSAWWSLGDRRACSARGTSGEGCDAADLRLPGRQEELLEARARHRHPGRAGAARRPAVRAVPARPTGSRRVVCGFFPGEEGAPALADVLAGRVDPAGRLPVSFPGAGVQPAVDLPGRAAGPAQRGEHVDPTPLFAVRPRADLHAGHVDRRRRRRRIGAWPTDGALRDRGAAAATTGDRHGVRGRAGLPARPGGRGRPPGAAADRRGPRVDLDPGETATVTFRLHADLTSYTGRDGERIVDPGAVELRVGASSADIRSRVPLDLVGETRQVGHDRTMVATVTTD